MALKLNPQKTGNKLTIFLKDLNWSFEEFRKKRLFNKIQTYCMFIGYPRSGHSLVGSLLDAHPNAAISHEIDAFNLIDIGATKNQIFTLILKNSEEYAVNKRQTDTYNYHVPNQWQGRFSKLKVIGDKKGGRSTSALIEKPNLLKKLEQEINLSIKFIHVIRNPYDNISTIAIRNLTDPKLINDRKLNIFIDRYFGNVAKNSEINKEFNNQVFNIRSEDIISDPKKCLEDLCGFFSLDYMEDYLNDCASIVYKEPHKSRYEINWSGELIRKVADKIREYDFLAGYTYDS